MFNAHCLCGTVRWELLTEPYAMYNCHCRMCQKVHGAAFGTYCFVKANQFRWLGSTDSIVQYASSDLLTRSSCSVCGSVVPCTDDANDHWVVPAGCHDHMRKPDYNIFVVDNSPWHTISGNLPQFDAYPPESGLNSVTGLPVPIKTNGPMQGGCLCGCVTYEVNKPLSVAHNCHCTRCRYGRAAAHASNGFVEFDALQFLSGEERLKSYKVPDAKYFTQVFCDNCSSLLPRRDEVRGVCVIPLSSLDNDPGLKPKDHIFVQYKATWHEITDDLPQFDQAPPS